MAKAKLTGCMIVMVLDEKSLILFWCCLHPSYNLVVKEYKYMTAAKEGNLELS